MTEKELIGKLQELRQIKPSQDWRVLVKKQILGETTGEGFISILETFPRLVFQYNKLAFASLLLFAFLAGAFTFAQNSLPGDPIYILKKVTEKSRVVFVSEEELPKVQLELANKRLEELSRIAQTNQVKKIAPALLEFQANISVAAENLTKTKQVDVKKIVAETKKIEENKQKIEALGVVVGETKELNDALSQLVKREIEYLEERTLTKDQEEVLILVKEDFEAEDYMGALEKILLLIYPQP